MCELMTIAAALVFSALFFAAKRRGDRAGALGKTALVFWGAALMWSVDCVHSLMEGQWMARSIPFFCSRTGGGTRPPSPLRRNKKCGH